MKYRDRTTMGGADEGFHTTCWTRIQNIKSLDQAERNLVMDDLIRRYWKPVYCYLRRKGYPNEAAKDLTQGFFIEVVLGRDLVVQADQHKGRFRTYLLTALDRYVIDIHRKQSAHKRSPAQSGMALDMAELPDLPAHTGRAGPDHVFHYAWAATLLDEVLQNVEQACCTTDKAKHWQVFKARVLDPIIHNTEPPSLERVCERFHIEGEARASNMIVTVKRKFRTVLEACLSQYVDSDRDVEQELGELMEILSRPCAG